ncbi:unnamed protein product, partial [Prorocentrum cordatum]
MGAEPAAAPARAPASGAAFPASEDSRLADPPSSPEAAAAPAAQLWARLVGLSAAERAAAIGALNGPQRAGLRQFLEARRQTRTGDGDADAPRGDPVVVKEGTPLHPLAPRHRVGAAPRAPAPGAQ